MRILSQRPTVERTKKEVEAVVGDDRAVSRQVTRYFYHNYSGKTLKEIGRHFGITESAVSQASRRVTLKSAKDATLRRKIKKLEDALKMSRVEAPLFLVEQTKHSRSFKRIRGTL